MAAPRIYGRKNGAWIELVDPARVYVRRTRAGTPVVTEWDPVSSFWLRWNGQWTATPRTWSPVTPANLRVTDNTWQPAARVATGTFVNNGYIQVSWDPTTGATGYDVRLQQYNSAGTAPVGTPRQLRVVTSSAVMDNLLELTNYTLEVRSIGAAPNLLESDWSAPIQYKTGAPEKYHSQAIADWSDTVYSGPTGWQFNVNSATYEGAHHDVSTLSWNGTYNDGWGWLLHSNLWGDCEVVPNPPRYDLVGDRPAFPYNPRIDIRPNERVKISKIQCGHHGVTGHWWNAFISNWTFSPGHQEYVYVHANSAGTKLADLTTIGVDLPFHHDWTEANNWSSAINVGPVDVRGDLGEMIQLWFTQYTPIANGAQASGLVKCAATVRFVWFHWQKWEAAHHYIYPTDAVAVAGRSPW